MVSLCTDFQLEVYHRAAGIPGVGIFIDATGSMVAQLAPNTPSVYNYCVTIPMTSQGLPVKPFVCLEVFTDDNRGVSLSTSFEYLRAAERDKKGGNVRVTHANIDCGKNLLDAVLKVYNGESLAQYVRRVQQELRGLTPRDLDKIIILWCDFHCVKAVRTHVNQAITVSVLLQMSSPMSKEEVLDLGKDIFRFMKTCVDFETFEKIVEQVRYILGTKYLPPAVLLTAGVLLQDKPLGCATPAEAVAARYFDVASGATSFGGGGPDMISLNGITSKYHPVVENRANPYYCPKLLDYFLEHWIPFTVLWADSAFQGARAPLRKTDSTSEINFGVLKNIEFGKDQRHIRADVYAAKRLQHFEGDSARWRREVEKRDASKPTANGAVPDKFLVAGVRVENTGVEPKEAWGPKRASSRVTSEDVALSTAAQAALALFKDQRKRMLKSHNMGDVVKEITALDKPGVSNQKPLLSASAFGQFILKANHLKTEVFNAVKTWVDKVTSEHTEWESTRQLADAAARTINADDPDFWTEGWRRRVDALLDGCGGVAKYTDVLTLFPSRPPNGSHFTLICTAFDTQGAGKDMVVKRKSSSLEKATTSEGVEKNAPATSFFVGPAVVAEETARAAVEEEKNEDGEEKETGWVTPLKEEGGERGATAPEAPGGSLPNNKKKHLSAGEEGGERMGGTVAREASTAPRTRATHAPAVTEQRSKRARTENSKYIT